MSVLIFFLVLFVLVLVHEWGHFITAKMTGMRVDEFGIGFPPKLLEHILEKLIKLYYVKYKNQLFKA